MPPGGPSKRRSPEFGRRIVGSGKRSSIFGAAHGVSAFTLPSRPLSHCTRLTALFCEAREERLRTDYAQLEESAVLAYAEVEAEREALCQELEGMPPDYPLPFQPDSK